MFHVNTDISSFTPPILKGSGCIIAIICIIERENLFEIRSKALSIIITLLSVILIVLCVMRIYISVAEIVTLAEKKSDMMRLQRVYGAEDGIMYSVKEIIALLEDNDIIEITLLCNESCLRIGTNSDSANGVSQLFDKRYYVDSIEYNDISYVIAILEEVATPDDKIYVIEIDGIRLS